MRKQPVFLPLVIIVASLSLSVVYALFPFGNGFPPAFWLSQGILLTLGIVMHQHCQKATRRIQDLEALLERINYETDIMDREFSRIEAELQDQYADSMAKEQLVRHQSEYLASLHATTQGIANRVDLTALLTTVIERAEKILGSTNSFIALLSFDESVMEIRIGTGIYENMKGTKIQKGIGVSGQVWETGTSLHITDYQSWIHRPPDPRTQSIVSLVALPLKEAGSLIGVIGVANLNDEVQFQDNDIQQFSRFAELASVALDNAHLSEKLQKQLADRQHYEEIIQHMAYHDSLTGLPNRHYLQEELSVHLEQNRIDHRLMAILVLDINGFKAINDTYGHEAGDSLLQEISRRLRVSIRLGDVVARVGSDEFTILLTHIQTIESAEKAARRILDSLHEPWSYGTDFLSITASIGIATFPDDGTDVHTLLKNADRAMCEAKRTHTPLYFFSPHTSS